MCLIIYKPKGLRLPKGKRLRKWFNSYPHGVGVAFQYRDKVRLLKGAMNINSMFTMFDRMRDILRGEQKEVRDVELIIQYRQAVTGSVCPRFCHPFPISSSQEELDSLDVITDAALAHNGVIWEYAQYSKLGRGKKEDINDAQEFIKDYVVRLGDSLWNQAVQKLIANYTYSKFAVLTPRGTILIGEFIKDQGYWYSNDGYKANNKQTYSNSVGMPKIYDEVCESREVYSEHDSELGLKGIRCDFCQELNLVVYYLPDADSLVCHDCFRLLEGRQPLMDEACY